MMTMPAARPSRPSIRLMALAKTTTVTTVTSGARSGESTMTSAPENGTWKNSIETPNSESRLPASTIPAIFAGGDTSRRSSSAPVANITPAARITPAGSDEPLNISRNCGIWDATPIATRNPTNMAAPPSSGIVVVWTSRALGTFTAPMRNASFRTRGTSANFNVAATKKTTAYPPISSSGPARPRASRSGELGVRGELPAQTVRLVEHVDPHRVVVGRPQHRGDQPRDLGHLGLGHARRGHRGGAEPQPARDERLLGVVRDRVLVARDPGAVERLLRDLARHAERPQVHEHQVVVGAAGDDAEPL